MQTSVFKQNKAAKNKRRPRDPDSLRHLESASVASLSLQPSNVAPVTSNAAHLRVTPFHRAMLVPQE